MELDKIKEQIKSIGRNEYLKEYSYRYYQVDNSFNFRHRNLISDNNLNTKYGNTRKGYEKFTKEVTRDIEHSGVISLRQYIVRNSEGHITQVGFIEETKTEIQDKDRQLKLDSIEDTIYKEFCKVFNIDNLIKENLVKNIREMDSFETKFYQNNKIEWYIERLEERDMFCGDELDAVTASLLDIGNLKLEGLNNEAN